MLGYRIAVIAGFLVASSGAFGQTARSEPASLTVDQLKGIYLRCDQLSSRAVLDHGSVIYCSMAAEELCRRGFNGSFHRMISWWRASRLEAGGVARSPTAPQRRLR